MGYYRGVPNRVRLGTWKRQAMERTAAAMRERNLKHGKGCKSRAKAIAARRGREVI